MNLFRLCFGETDGGTFRHGEDGCGNVLQVGSQFRLAKNVSERGETLCRGSMGEGTEAIDVADGIDAGDRGLHVFIDGDASWRVGNACSLQVEVLEARAATDSHEHRVGDDFGDASFALKTDVEFPVACAVSMDGGDGRAGVNGDAAFLESSAESAGDVTVKSGKNFGCKFHHRDFTAETAEDGSKFKSHHSAADDAEPFGHMVQTKHFF